MRTSQRSARWVERERESAGHEQALDHSQDRENREVGSEGQRRGRDGEQKQAQADRALAFQRPAERTEQQARYGHAERAGVRGQPDLRRRHAIIVGEARQDRLGGEQVDQSQKADHRDEQRSLERQADGPRRHAQAGRVRASRLRQDEGWRPARGARRDAWDGRRRGDAGAGKLHCRGTRPTTGGRSAPCRG